MIFDPIYHDAAERIIDQINHICKQYKEALLEHGADKILRVTAISAIRDLKVIPPFSEHDAIRWLDAKRIPKPKA